MDPALLHQPRRGTLDTVATSAAGRAQAVVLAYETGLVKPDPNATG